MHISYDHDIDSFLDGTRGMLLERIMGETGLGWIGDTGALYLDTPPEHLSDALFTFAQALTRVYDLTLLSRSNVGSTFYDDLADLLFRFVDRERIKRDFRPDVPNANSYLVDYRIESKSEAPLFLYGILNRDKARLTTIMLQHFHLSQLSFESLLVFKNQAEIPRMDLARLSDVGGEMISSLASHDDFKSKIIPEGRFMTDSGLRSIINRKQFK